MSKQQSQAPDGQETTGTRRHKKVKDFILWERYTEIKFKMRLGDLQRWRKVGSYTRRAVAERVAEEDRRKDYRWCTKEYVVTHRSEGKPKDYEKP